jgi:diguanylate cyclase (GGDEF)-like protein
LFDSGRRQLIGMRIQCPNLSAVEVEQPPPDDPFKLAIIPIDRLLGWDVAPLLAHRVHVRGRVTLFWPGSTVCLRDATQGLCAQTNQSTLIRTGELIDMAGFVTEEGSTPVLTGALFRDAGLAAAAPQTAMPVTAEQVLLGGHESQLVQIDGQLVSRDSTLGATTLLLKSAKFVFTVILPRKLTGPEADTWKIGSVLRVTGICSVQIEAQRTALGLGEAVPKMFQVLVSKPADIVLVQSSSWWTPHKALVVVVLILCGTLAVFAWVVALRNRVKQQTRLLRESEERFRHMALHDALTGLASRLLLQDRLKIAAEAAKRHKTMLAFLIVDIDSFKDINDSFGHPAGDEVLRVTANRLLQAVRISDTVARIGGDELVVLLPEVGDLKAAGTIAQKLVAALGVPIPIEERLVPVTVSIGVCTSVGRRSGFRRIDEERRCSPVRCQGAQPK